MARESCHVSEGAYTGDACGGVGANMRVADEAVNVACCASDEAAPHSGVEDL